MTNQEFIALVKKNPITTACIAVTLAVGVGVYFRSGAIPAAEDELAQRSAQAEKYALNIKYSTQLKDQHDALVAANKKIEGRLTRASQQGINTQYFYKLERETGVKLVSFSQSSAAAPKAAKAAFVSIPFNVAVQGTMAQVTDFLRQLEGGSHFCRVLAANFSVNPGARNGPITLSLNLELLGQP
jgi:hypothetical protein